MAAGWLVRTETASCDDRRWWRPALLCLCQALGYNTALRPWDLSETPQIDLHSLQVQRARDAQSVLQVRRYLLACVVCVCCAFVRVCCAFVRIDACLCALMRICACCVRHACCETDWAEEGACCVRSKRR
jgi:hypothetical protein